VVGTDEHLILTVHPDVISSEVRARFEHDRNRDDPLDPTTAVAVLQLVRKDPGPSLATMTRQSLAAPRLPR
jgi:hypothetical protein